MKILVTGADGMLGSNLVRMLLEKGFQVSVFLFIYTKANTLNDLKIKRYYGDITIPHSLDQAFKENDIIIHAAASTSIWPVRSKKTRNINIVGTQNIINKALQFQIKKLIYIGSASSLRTKKDELKNISRTKVNYIESKLYALELVLKSIKENRLPATVILPTYMIGPFDSKPGSGKLVLNFAKGKIKFYTKGGRNFVHVKDVANAIINSLGSETNGKSYVIGNKNLTYKEFFGLASNILSRPQPRYLIPDWIIKIVGFMWEVTAMISKKEPLLNYQTASISCEKHFSEENSEQELEITHTPIPLAIKDCYEWFHENKYL